MKHKLSIRCIFPVLVFLITIFPMQLVLANSVPEVETLVADSKVILNAEEPDLEPSADVPVLDDDSKKTKVETGPNKSEKTSLSTGAKVGIGVGAVVLVGGVLALAGGSGGSSGSSGSGSSSSSSTPPTADHLVDAWQATANQPGSGLTYTGTYHLYQGGAISYAVYVSDGQTFSGGGSWTLEGYRLTIRTDHGSIYNGSFAPGNIQSVDLNSNTGWNLYLTR